MPSITPLSGWALSGLPIPPEPPSDPLYSYAHATDALDMLINGRAWLDAADSVIAAPEFYGFNKMANLFESFAGADIAAADVMANLVERINASDVITVQSLLTGDLVSVGTFADVVHMTWFLMLQDAAATTDEAVAKRTQVAALLDGLLATGAIEGRLSAKAACATVAAIEDMVRAGWAKEAITQAAIVDGATATLKILAPLLDSAHVADDATAGMRLSLVCADSVDVADDLAASMRMMGDLSDGAMAYVTIRLGGSDYSGWAVNTDLGAATEHRNQQFDSIVSFKGHHYAAGPGGIVQITGKTDDGEPIDAWVRTFLTDFGTQQFKRAPDIYLGLQSDGPMIVKAITRDPVTGVKTEDWYEIVQRQQGGPGTGRFKLGRGLKSIWWGLELRNVDGADFKINQIGWRRLVLDRRL